MGQQQHQSLHRDLPADTTMSRKPQEITHHALLLPSCPTPRPGHLNDSEKYLQGLRTILGRDRSRRRCQAGEVGAGRYLERYRSLILGGEGELERTGSDVNRRDGQSPAALISEVSRFDTEWKSLRQICSYPPASSPRCRQGDAPWFFIPPPGTCSDGDWDPALPARGVLPGSLR